MRDRRRAAAKRKRKKDLELAEKRRAYGVTPVYDDNRSYVGYMCDKTIGGCGGIIMTVLLDKGAIPMFMKCFATPECDNVMNSMGFAKTPPPRKIPLVIEWYEVDEDEVMPTPQAEEHARKGGLFRRPGPDAKEWQKDKMGQQFKRRNDSTPHQLTLISGGSDDQDTAAQEQGDHVHLPSSEGVGGEGAEPRPAGKGDAAEAAEPPQGVAGSGPDLHGGQSGGR